jgi:hypothetical protein
MFEKQSHPIYDRTHSAMFSLFDGTFIDVFLSPLLNPLEGPTM